MEDLAAELGVEISNPDKILFPKSGITKQELVNYYIEVSPYILPHLKDRPISMQRFPQGITRPGFYKKERDENAPAFVKKIRIKFRNGESKDNVLVHNPQTLAYLANQNNIPIHIWLSRKGSINKPDMIIWDLDPTASTWERVREGAFIMKEEIEKHSGITPYIKTTGSRGLHLVIILNEHCTFNSVRKTAKKWADHLATKYPKLFTTEMLKENRADKIFVDYLRNGFAQTAVAPYSVRPKENAPVAMPITWKQLEQKDFHPQYYNIRNALNHLDKTGDLWRDIYKTEFDLKQLHI